MSAPLLMERTKGLIRLVEPEERREVLRYLLHPVA